MQQYELVLDIYRAAQSGYFRIENTVALDMDITYPYLLFCHVIS